MSAFPSLDSIYEERKTPRGFLVKIKLAKMNYVVFTAKGPEIPKGSKNHSIIVPVPKIAFLGDGFDLSHFRLGELSFVNVTRGKLVIPFQHASTGSEVRSVFLNSGSECDVLPVIILHYRKCEDLLRARAAGIEIHHLVLDENFPREDLISQKIRFPSLNMLIIRSKAALLAVTKDKNPENMVRSKNEIEKNSNVVDFKTVRASDLAEKENLNLHSVNPVFLAQVHLQKNELEKVKQLLLDFSLDPEEITFIRIFLELMIRDDGNKEERRSRHNKLLNLNEGFRLAGLILGMRVVEFEAELEKGFSLEIASMVLALLEKGQSESNEIEREIILWEWKLKTKRLFKKNA
ncbi:hypothetical protein LEP1GSC047_2293 [Leptospira inadai serovar Lyme str. 10]|uniref:Uncharacterized protein n=2 Tax=Leptospira inadai serovar Lyme TaxID=293084 RepID=V6HNA2_9LEPT|nr:hypothetical protein [Leptospira inadai]EQA38360.1 hypothetical protein LEP1GSC047_2293 [Leptospira inadai serovar Lyme str. 10]PNV72858.1 hypothetical protein BES34_018505 [Leptospira inadai serovar Lyme]